MGTYIASNDNRFYAAQEETYGIVPGIAGQHRIPAVKLALQERRERPTRRDKLGTRTYPGEPAGGRVECEYELRTYMTAWSDWGSEPRHGALVAAALGGPGRSYSGGTVAAMPTETRLTCTAAHGLTAGEAVVVNGELRFVTAVVDAATVETHAPFSAPPLAGTPITPTYNYAPGSSLPSLSLFDYWSPAEAVQRMLTGAAVDRMTVVVNGDYHEFEFRGPGSEVVDSTTFTSGQGGLDGFPTEPSTGDWDATIVPGHLGAVWIGNSSEQRYTLTEAELTVENNVTGRSREFGSSRLRGIHAGARAVTLSFSLYCGEDEASESLYQASRQRSPVTVALQLGTQAGQLVGLYLPAVVPEPPGFDDEDTRLVWDFQGCRAQGTHNDEIFIAFG